MKFHIELKELISDRQPSVLELIKRRYKQAKVLAHGEEKKFKGIEYEEGSGNVFADLGLPDADELFTRAQIGFVFNEILKEKNLKQRDGPSLGNIAARSVAPYERTF